MRVMPAGMSAARKRARKSLRRSLERLMKPGTRWGNEEAGAWLPPELADCVMCRREL